MSLKSCKWNMKIISEKLLNKLACPQCKKKLEFEEKKSRLLCRNCLLNYPIINAIPILIPAEAEKVNQG